ncbi:MAG: hypothetical protein U0230_27550 [Polyangiales bacterium]
MWTTNEILDVLDACCDEATFPMLDNGYVYLAATRLSLHRSDADWALVIEVFGFSPRTGLPDVQVYTFGSRLHDRVAPPGYSGPQAAAYLENNPNNDLRFASPIDAGDWRDDDTDELVSERATSVTLRGKPVPIPTLSDLAAEGIEPQEPPRIATFELCRFLAARHRSDVLATPIERRVSVPPELEEILVLDEWHHPNIVDDEERPSGSETFRQLAEVLTTGDTRRYRPSAEPNTHWSNWPEGGTL